MISLDDYDYHLPNALLAKAPVSPRDAARLFVYDTQIDEVFFDTFLNIAKYLPKRSLLVFNNTKVIPARLWLNKETGGKIEVLLMMNEYRPGDILIKGIVDRKILPGAKLYFKNRAHLEVIKQEEQFFFFKPSISMKMFSKLLKKEGVTPIPPYIKRSNIPEHDLRQKYQSILAKYPASIAAPTASLHFTNRLLAKLEHREIKRTEITLHVGAGTFAPVDEKNIREKKLFTEPYDISHNSAQAINRAKAAGIPIIAVGTTAMRTLESAAHVNSKTRTWNVASGSRSTNIFIYPPHKFTIADGLITNFHVPCSSLMLLVDALLKHKKAKRDILALYDIAISEKFRFYSFGDGMLII